MTTNAGCRIRVSNRPDQHAAGVSSTVLDALTMLADARRVVLVGPDEPADIVHTIGDAECWRPGTGHRVHTVDRVPLRAGRLSPAPGWLRRERRRIGSSATWIVHGQTAGRLLAQSGIIASSRLRCLPLLSPQPAEDAVREAGQRAATRTLLGVAPGVKLVVGVEAAGPDAQRADWYRDASLTNRCDAVVARVRQVGSDAYCVRRPNGELVGPFALATLLEATDLFVAAAHALEAWSAAVAAVAAGLTVVAAASDSSAELVLSSGHGTVVPFAAAAIAAAVAAELDSGLQWTRRNRRRDDPPPGCAELARSLLATYRQVLLRSTSWQSA